MSRFIALDWDKNQLHVVAALVKHGVVHIDGAVTWREEEPVTPEKLGAVLRERLKAAGIAAAPVLACVGRERVILKEIRHPAVPPAEEPAVVRFQVIKELNEPAEQVIIDYVPTGEDGNGKTALAVVMRKDVLDTYQKLCKAAGLKLSAVVPRPFSAMACLRYSGLAPNTVDTIALLTIGERGGELSVARGDTVLFSRSLATGAMLAGEVKRNLMVYAGQASHNPVTAVFVADSGEHAELRTKLQALIGLPVQGFVPIADKAHGLAPVGLGGFVGAVGLLYAKAAKRLPINFVKPHQPAPQRDRRREMLILGGSIAAALLLAAVGFGYMQIAKFDRIIEDKNNQKADLRTHLASLAEDDKRIKAVGDWADNEIVWLDELYDLTDRFPDINSVRLTQMTAIPVQHTAKEKYAAHLTLQGIATGVEPVNKLMKHLEEDKHYNPGPKLLTGNRSLDRRTFPEQFTTKIEVERQSPDKYTLQLPESPPDSPRRRKEAGGGIDLGGFGGGLQP